MVEVVFFVTKILTLSMWYDNYPSAFSSNCWMSALCRRGSMLFCRVVTTFLGSSAKIRDGSSCASGVHLHYL
jgi:hypothetical protein